MYLMFVVLGYVGSLVWVELRVGCGVRGWAPVRRDLGG